MMIKNYNHLYNAPKPNSNDNELDLESFFDEFDAKEAMEASSDKPPTTKHTVNTKTFNISSTTLNHQNDDDNISDKISKPTTSNTSNITHIDYKQNIHIDRNGYSSSSSANNISSSGPENIENTENNTDNSRNITFNGLMFDSLDAFDFSV